MPLKEAVERTIDKFIEEGILADFLKENKAEAIKVSIYEYDEGASSKAQGSRPRNVSCCGIPSVLNL